MITVVLWVLQCYLLCCCVAAAIDDKSLGWCRLWFRVGLFLLALNRGLRTCIDVIIQLLQTLSSCYCVASLIFYPHDSSVEQIDLMCIFFTIDNNIYDFTVSEWERVNRNRRIWQVYTVWIWKTNAADVGCRWFTGKSRQANLFTVHWAVMNMGTGGSILRYDHFLCGKRIFTSRPRASRSAGWLLCVLRVCLYMYNY